MGTVGGGQRTQAEARSQQVRTQQTSKYDSIQKRQAARDLVKKREEEEIQQKKTAQRRKTEQNQKTEEERQRKLEEDHRQKNEAFLRRLESEQKSKARSKSKPSPGNREPAMLSETVSKFYTIEYNYIVFSYLHNKYITQRSMIGTYCIICSVCLVISLFYLLFVLALSLYP